MIRQRPLNSDERAGMIISPEENILQQELDRFHEEVTQNKLVTNEKKTQIMLFNPSKKHVFPAEFTIGPSEILQVKPVLKILGIQIQNDLKWGAQAKYGC